MFYMLALALPACFSKQSLPFAPARIDPGPVAAIKEAGTTPNLQARFIQGV